MKSNPCPLQWKHGVLTTGPPGNSCIVISYLATSLNSFIISNSVLCVWLLYNFPVYSVMSSTNSDSFTSSFPIQIFFFFFLIWTVARTSNTILSKSGKHENFCFVPIHTGNALAFHCWTWCYLWACHIWPLLCWSVFPLFLLYWEFLIINGSWIFSKAFSVSIEMKI